MRGRVTQQAAFEVGRAFAERLEYELLGAWQAGYDFLYVVADHEVGQTPPTQLTISHRVLPSNTENLNPGGAMDLAYRYDLRDVSYADIQEARV